MDLTSNIIGTSQALAAEKVQMTAGVSAYKMALDVQSGTAEQLIQANTEIMKQMGVGNNVDIRA